MTRYKCERKSITGFPGYEIDTEGQVWSSHKRSSGRALKQNVTTLRTGQKGYYFQVRLFNGSKFCTKTIHRLVAQAFIPNPSNKPMACHRDSNPKNNRVNNLYWGTAKENQHDRIQNNTDLKGIKNPESKLTEKQVRVIKWALYYGAAHRYLAKVFKVTHTNIGHIARGKSWTHVNILPTSI